MTATAEILEKSDLTIDETLQHVQDAISRNAWADTPLWQDLTSGNLNLEQLKEFVLQFGVFALHNHNFHGPLYVSCPDPKWRAMLAEVVYEEGTGNLYSNGKPHNELWCEFGEAVGLTRDEMWNAELSPVTTAFKGYLTEICHRSFLEGVSALMMAGEAQAPGNCARIAEALKKKFDLSDEAVMFWTVHEVADEDHSGTGRELMEQFAQTQEQRHLVVETVEEYLRVERALQRDIYERMQALA